jgi:hypothetical protein
MLAGKQQAGEDQDHAGDSFEHKPVPSSVK